MNALTKLPNDLPQAPPDAEPTSPEGHPLFAHAADIARRGYDEAVIAMALGRRGATAEIARLLATSVVRGRTPVAEHPEENFTPPPVRRSRAPSSAQELEDVLEHHRQALLQAGRAAELRSARAASRALGAMVQFFFFVIVGLGVGAWLGWSIGFSHGMEEGLERVLALLEQVLGR